MNKKIMKFKVNGSNEIQLGHLVKDKLYKNKYKITTMDKKSSYCISLLDMIEKI